MRTITLSLLVMASVFPAVAQTPGGPVPEPAQPQASTPAQPAPAPPAATVAPSAPAAPVESPMAAANSQIVVPRDTRIPMILITTINTKSAYVGQSIYCESVYPIAAKNHIIIPKGTSIRGVITLLVPPGRVKGRGELGLRFDQLVLPNGTTRELRASLSGFGSASNDKFKPKEGQIEGSGSKGEDAGKIVGTTVTGTELGSIIGWGEGHPGTGAGIGAAAGAAGGLAWVLASRGKYIVLPHGTSLELELQQPLSFDREEVAPHSPYDAGPMLPRGDYPTRY